MDIYVKLITNIIKEVECAYDFSVQKFICLPIKDNSNNIRLMASASYELKEYESKEDEIIFLIKINEFNKEFYLNDENIQIKNILHFFKSLNILEENLVALASYVFAILHELGHIHYYNKYKSKLKYMKTFRNAIENVNLMFHNIPRMDENFRPFYNELQSEANADVFAYNNFYFIWKKLNLDEFYKNNNQKGEVME